ncbi:PTS sugar transporter subunit IIB [Clostridium pasteurianum]|uniref:Phosphotransferase system, mannose/fructose/N-acetylgalactosamine-specific component IIB n=1 Tax=Clostridium pasteurianum BC1 TaxID=86416 RepID=R4KGC0_CLOPA|nr:PTS sugar transporter subunit IIB [Clostridium pasteurianum]AGK98660.1 phosphotransferase system, mannose/fructose/N-acetylgalactosamine-specific component IIB [Clostridium pasteurianum BC1]
MSIQLARIDQRLIHGLVVTQWASATKATRLMVIDDQVSKDEGMKASMRLSKPTGVSMSIIDTNKAINNFNNHNYDIQRVFIVVKEPETLKKLVDAGVELPKVNVGIMFFSEEKEKISKFVAITEEEKKDLQYIIDKGVPVNLQYVPTDTEQNFADVLNAKK